MTPDHREKIAEENLEVQLDLTLAPNTPEFAVVDPLGKLVASQVGVYKPGGFIAFLETAESAYRLRSGATRYPSWPFWAFGRFLIAVACLIAIRTRIRRENERRTGTDVISSRRSPGLR